MFPRFLEIYIVPGSMELYIEVSCIFPVIDILSRAKESLQWKIWKRFLHLIFHQTSWFHAYFIQHKGKASQRERVCIYIYIYLSMDNSLRNRFIEKLFFPTGFEYIIVPFDRKRKFIKWKYCRLCENRGDSIVHLVKKIRFTLHSHYSYFISVKLIIILKILKLMIYKNNSMIN